MEKPQRRAASARRSQDGMMMKRKDGNTRFWEPGFFIFEDELAKAERDRLAPKKAELKSTTDAARRAELKQEIEAIKAEFKTKRKNARYSLFGKA